MTTGPLGFRLALMLLTTAVAFGQSGEDQEASETAEDFFSDPFAVAEEGEETAVDLDLFFSEPEAADDGDILSIELGDVDSLFEGEMLEIAEETEAGFSPQDDLLSRDDLLWGGRISGSIRSEWSWDKLWTGDLDIGDPGGESLLPSVSSDLFFDARPNPAFRAFGKLRISTESGDTADFATVINNAALTGDLPEGWTREENEDGDTVIRDADGEEVATIAAEEEEAEEDPQTGAPPSVNLQVVELFSDFQYEDLVFFRFGKHTIKWGVGYFWSPADVLNLTAIDVEDPTADREGPVSLRIHYPFDLNNLYLYVITNTQAKPLEIAVAPKLEFVTGTTEVALAAYYQQALAPRGIVSFSSSIEDVDLFGEGVVSFGSERVFIRESRKTVDDFADPPEDLSTILDTFQIENAPLFSGTVGFRYLKDIDQGDSILAPGSIMLIGQYFYNGEGYGDSSLLKSAVFLQQNPEYNGLALDETKQGENYQAPPDLTTGDFSPWGRHYAALTIGWSDIFESEMNVTIFTLANMSDLSGIVSPSLSFRLFDTFDVSLGLRMTFGADGDEYTNPQALFGFGNGSDSEGSTLSFSANVSLGGGSF